MLFAPPGEVSQRAWYVYAGYVFRMRCVGWCRALHEGEGGRERELQRVGKEGSNF